MQQEVAPVKHLSDRINNLSESATIQMAQLSRELKQNGIDIIDLSLGEPDFDTPQHIKNAAKKAIDEGYTHYTPVPGYLDLRKAISEKFLRDNGLEYSPEQIVVSTGAKQSIANVVLCLVNPGDEVILPAPYWVTYAAIADMAQGKKVELATSIESDFKITGKMLENAISDRSRLMIFSSPCNPTGSVYTKAELKELAEVIYKHPQLFVISDEIYEYINFEGNHESLGQFDMIKDQLITVNGFSKGFAMTGWRVGYIGAPLWIAKACTKIQGQFTSGTCSIAQKAAQMAISSDLSPSFKMRDEFKKRRDMVLELLKEIPGMKVNEPKGAFYVFPDISAYFGKSYDGRTIENPSDLSMYLLEVGNVALVAGDAFGDHNGIRFSYAASEKNLREAIKRMKEALAKLQ